MRTLLQAYCGPAVVYLLADDWTGDLVVRLNNQPDYRLPRGNAVQLAQQLEQFLEATQECPRCHHGRLEHFRLFTEAGYLHGCSHGTEEHHQLAAGLPCDCPGEPS